MTDKDIWAGVRYSVESLSNGVQRLSFYIDAADMARCEERVLRGRAARLRLPGFRPGRVPLPLARQHYGNALRAEVFEEEGKAALASVLRRLNPGRLIAAPELIPPPLDSRGGELEFVAQYELWPVVVAPDTTGLAVDCCTAVVAGDDIDRQLQSLRLRQAQRIEVSRPPRQGDWVTLDYRLERQTGAEVFSREGVELLFDPKSQLPPTPPPELFNALEASEPGAVGEFELCVAEDHPEPELRGVTLCGHYRLHKVCEPQLPELNEAFCSTLGIAEGGVKALRAELQRSLESAVDAATRRHQRKQLFDALLERAELPEPPSGLLRGEIATMRTEWARRNEHLQAKTDDLPDELFETGARRRVQLGLVLGALIEQLELSVGTAEVQAAIAVEAERQQEPEQLLRWYRENPRALRHVEQSILEEKVVEHLLTDAVVTQRQMPLDELLGNTPVAQS